MSETMQVVTAVIGFLTFVFNGIMGYLVLKLNRQQRDTSTAVSNVQLDMSDVKNTVNEAASHAVAGRRQAQTAAGAAIQTDKKADTIGAMLSRVEKQTNGINERLRAERDAAVAKEEETRRRLEEALAALPPKPLEEKLNRVVEEVHEIVETSKSGTKLPRVVVPRDPAARERHDDPKE